MLWKLWFTLVPDKPNKCLLYYRLFYSFEPSSKGTRDQTEIGTLIPNSSASKLAWVKNRQWPSQSRISCCFISTGRIVLTFPSTRNQRAISVYSTRNSLDQKWPERVTRIVWLNKRVITLWPQNLKLARRFSEHHYSIFFFISEIRTSTAHEGVLAQFLAISWHLWSQKSNVTTAWAFSPKSNQYFQICSCLICWATKIGTQLISVGQQPRE